MGFNRELPIITLNVGGVSETIDPNDDLKIFEADLKTEFSEQASKFAFYGGLHSDALITLETFKNNLKKYEAENELVMRDRIHTRYGEKERITIGMMEAEFARDNPWQMLSNAILEWERTVKRLEVIKDAFKQRSQMLWQLGATARQEMLRLNVTDNE